jgi:hypothetical protein
MAQTITQVKHNNKSIIIMDYSRCDREELLKRVTEVMAWITKQPQNSLLTITNVTEQHFDRETVDAFKKLALYNKPYVKAGAVVGISGLLKIAYSTIMKFSGRNMPLFNTRDEAIAWLAEQ